MNQKIQNPTTDCSAFFRICQKYMKSAYMKRIQYTTMFVGHDRKMPSECQ